LKDELGLDAELQVGSSGVFEISVDGAVVAKRGFVGFPSDDEIVNAVAQATAKS